jgi:hypothetical protein
MEHHVEFTIPYRELGKCDIVFHVWGDGEKLGELQISKGSLVWYPKGPTHGHKISWAQFDRVMRDYPKAEKRT